MNSNRHSSRVWNPAERRARRNNRKKRRRLIVKTALITMFAACFAVLFLMPIVLTVTNSFMSASEISANYGQVFATSDTGGKTYIASKVNLKFIPDMVSFSQYITVLFKSPEYLFKFWNSVILVVPIVIFQLLVAAGASYGFARYRGRLKEIIFFVYIILMLMPYQVTLVPNYLVSEWLNILDTRWAIWLPGIFSPFAVFLLTKYMRRIPESVMEAAQIDGASFWQRLKSITLPMLTGSIMINLVFGITYGLKVFDIIYVLTNGGPGHATEVVTTYSYQLYADGAYGMSTAFNTVLLILTAIAGIFVVKMMSKKEVQQ